MREIEPPFGLLHRVERKPEYAQAYQDARNRYFDLAEMVLNNAPISETAGIYERVTEELETAFMSALATSTLEPEHHLAVARLAAAKAWTDAATEVCEQAARDPQDGLIDADAAAAEMRKKFGDFCAALVAPVQHAQEIADSRAARNFVTTLLTNIGQQRHGGRE